VSLKKLRVVLKDLSDKTEAGEITLEDAARDLAKWLAVNYKPQERRRPPFGIRLKELQALAKIQQSKVEVPLRQLLLRDKERPRRRFPPRPGSTPQT